MVRRCLFPPRVDDGIWNETAAGTALQFEKENDCTAPQLAAPQQRKHSILFYWGCCSALVSSHNSIVTCTGVYTRNIPCWVSNIGNVVTYVVMSKAFILWLPGLQTVLIGKVSWFQGLQCTCTHITIYMYIHKWGVCVVCCLLTCAI